jgi:hypothetical protein
MGGLSAAGWTKTAEAAAKKSAEFPILALRFIPKCITWANQLRQGGQLDQR